MSNESSFFERLTGSKRGAGGENAAQTTKRVDFKQKKKEGTKGPNETMPMTTPLQETPVKEILPSETPAKDGSLSVAPAKANVPEEKHEQWLEEAQEGQLTIDVYQTDSDIVIQSTVAGVKAEDLDISITNDMVTIRGRRNRDEEVPPGNYFYQECYWGPFSRSIILPTDINADQVEATMREGILTVRLPKVEKEQTKKIKVKPLS